MSLNQYVFLHHGLDNYNLFAYILIINGIQEECYFIVNLSVLIGMLQSENILSSAKDDISFERTGCIAAERPYLTLQ